MLFLISDIFFFDFFQKNYFFASIFFNQLYLRIISIDLYIYSNNYYIREDYT